MATIKMEPGRYAVIGASGILAPLGSRLAGPGVSTTGIARGSRPPEAGWDEWVSLDVCDVGAVTRWTGSSSPADVLVAYSPAVADDVWPLLRRVAGRLVVVATTEWTDPAAPVPAWSGLADAGDRCGDVRGPVDGGRGDARRRRGQ